MGFLHKTIKENKTFHQGRLSYLLALSLYLIFIAVGVIAIVLAIIEKTYYIAPFGLVPIYLVGKDFIATVCYHITFREDIIFVSGELGKIKYKNQYKDEIAYSEIKDICLICSRNNSNKKPIVGSSVMALKPKLFLEFILKNNETKWVFVSYFSRNQLIKMIELINKKTNLSINYEEMQIQNRTKHKRVYCKKP